MKKRKSFIFLSFLLTGMFVISGCNSDEGPFVEFPVIDEISNVEYNAQVQPIFNSYCITCHTDLHAKLNLMTCCSYDQLLNSGFNAPYVSVLNPSGSRLYKHLVGELSIMPPSGKISEENINMILKWIEEGAKNN